MTTDVEKAFDMVNWAFMFAVLKRMGLGDHMIQWIAKVYAITQALVKVNGVFSKPFFYYFKWHPSGLSPFTLTICSFVSIISK